MTAGVLAVFVFLMHSLMFEVVFVHKQLLFHFGQQVLLVCTAKFQLANRAGIMTQKTVLQHLRMKQLTLQAKDAGTYSFASELSRADELCDDSL